MPQPRCASHLREPGDEFQGVPEVGGLLVVNPLLTEDECQAGRLAAVKVPAEMSTSFYGDIRDVVQIDRVVEVPLRVDIAPGHLSVRSKGRFR